MLLTICSTSKSKFWWCQTYQVSNKIWCYFFSTENARHLSNFHWVSEDFGWDFIHIKIAMNFQSQPCSRTRWVSQNFILQITLMTILEAIERSDMIFMFVFILYCIKCLSHRSKTVQSNYNNFLWLSYFVKAGSK